MRYFEIIMYWSIRPIFRSDAPSKVIKESIKYAVRNGSEINTFMKKVRSKGYKISKVKVTEVYSSDGSLRKDVRPINEGG